MFLKLRKGKGKRGARRTRMPRMPLSVRALALALPLAAAGAGAGVWWHAGGVEARVARLRAVDDTTRAAFGLELQEIWVRGRKRTSVEELRTTLNLARGDSIWRVRPHQLRERVLELDWVRDAHLRRTFPDTLSVELFEREPCARLQRDGAFYLVDDEGAVFLRLDSPATFADLPLLVGRGAASGCAEWSGWAAFAEATGVELAAAVRVSERRWNLVLRGGVELMLPEREAAARLAEVEVLEARYGLLSHLRSVARDSEASARDPLRIDLRTPERIRLRGADTRPAAISFELLESGA